MSSAAFKCTSSSVALSVTGYHCWRRQPLIFRAAAAMASAGAPSTIGRLPPPQAAPSPPDAAAAAAAAAQPPLKKHMRVVETVTAPSGFEPCRLPAALRSLLPQRYPSDSAAKKAARRGEAIVDGCKGGVETQVAAGAVIEIVQRCGVDAVQAAGRPGLDIAYEDEHMACIVKPQGLPTQGKGEGTVQGRVKYCLLPSTAEGCLARPHHAHRLDAPTGGLVLIAKTRVALGQLGQDLAHHRMQKRYVALAEGRLEGEGLVDFDLDGRRAVTLFRAVAHAPAAGTPGGWVTRLHLWPKTGRMHQLRKHMAYLGHPLLGDKQYRYRRKDGIAVTRCDIDPVLASLLDGCGAGGGDNEDSGGEGEGAEEGAEEGCGEAEAGAAAAAGEAGTGPEGSSSGGVGKAQAAAGKAECGEKEESGGGGDTAGREPLCLWAVELHLLHPVTREPLHMRIPDPPAYDAICPVPAPAAPADGSAPTPP